MADIVLLLVLSIGELLVREVFLDVGLNGLHRFAEDLIYLFPAGLFFLVFYLPVRYVHTVEDFTFVRTPWDWVERIGSFALVFILFLAAG